MLPVCQARSGLHRGRNSIRQVQHDYNRLLLSVHCVSCHKRGSLCVWGDGSVICFAKEKKKKKKPIQFACELLVVFAEEKLGNKDLKMRDLSQRRNWPRREKYDRSYECQTISISECINSKCSFGSQNISCERPSRICKPHHFHALTSLTGFSGRKLKKLTSLVNSSSFKTDIALWKMESRRRGTLPSCDGRRQDFLSPSKAHKATSSGADSR